MFDLIRAWCTDRFTHYNSDGAEFWYREGYYRAWMDHAMGNDADRDGSIYDCPQCYHDDYRRGYDDGYEECSMSDDSRLREVVYDEPQF